MHDPSKAEAVAKYCDRWWVHTPEGVVDDLSDVPPAWGLREWTGKQWRTIREAGQTEAAPITRHFLAALLRRGDELMKSMIREANTEGFKRMQEEQEKRRSEFNEQVQRAVDRRTQDYAALKTQLDTFEEAFGEPVTNWSPDMKALGHAAKALVAADNSWSENRAERLRTAADALNELTAICKPDEATPESQTQ